MNTLIKEDTMNGLERQLYEEGSYKNQTYQQYQNYKKSGTQFKIRSLLKLEFNLLSIN